MMQLYDYQQELKNGIYQGWQNGANVMCGVLPTGGGKTVIMSDIVNDAPNLPTVCIAHREELVGQISTALARYGIHHNIMAPETTVRKIARRHIKAVNAVYINSSSPHTVAGVDTLVNRMKKDGFELFSSRVRRWIGDEGHHFLKDNKWGRSVSPFTNAKGLLVTATPERADGRGLGSHAEGLIDQLIIGPTMRELINRGRLSDFELYCPPTDDLDLEGIKVDANGNYNAKELRKRVKHSKLIGNVVEHYCRYAMGRKGVTFVESLETAAEMNEQYLAAGVRSMVVSSKSSPTAREAAIEGLEAGELDQLVNVDLFGEGFDLPAIETAHFARPTQSYSLFVQQTGRALRVAEGKDKAMIFDHVGNYIWHSLRNGAPDTRRDWSLDSRPKGTRSSVDPDAIPLIACPECTKPYEKLHERCPYCGHQVEPASRTQPDQVDGDLTQLTPEAIAALRAQMYPHEEAAIEAQAMAAGKRAEKASGNWKAYGQAKKKYIEAAEAQRILRENMAWWATMQQALGRDRRECNMRFYWRFKIDVLNAQSLPAKQAWILAQKISNDIARLAA